MRVLQPLHTIELRTERLHLRPLVASDADVLFRMNSNPEVLRYTTWNPWKTNEDVLAWLRDIERDQYQAKGYGRLAVTLKDNNTLVGTSGIRFRKERQAPDLGYRFLPEFWNNGYATEAGQVSLIHGFHTLGFSEIFAWAFPENIASCNVLKKLGFKPTTTTQDDKGRTLQTFCAKRNVDHDFGNKPVLETERFLFFPITEKDTEVMYALNCDFEVIRYTGDGPFESLSAAHDFFVMIRERSIRHGYGRWKMVLRDTGECVGWCGLKFHDDEKITDVGYRFFRRHWGKGYATESCKAAVQFGFERLGLNEIYAHARVENSASQRVLEKSGLSFVKHGQECGGEIGVYRIAR